MNANNSARGSEGPLALFSGSIVAILLRLGGLAILDAFALTFIYRLMGDGSYYLAFVIGLVTLGVNAVFLSEKLYPFRWFSPGLALMILMIAYPTTFTIYVAFTNYSTGNLLTQIQAVERIEKRAEYRYLPEGEEGYSWTAYRNDSGEYLLWLVGKGSDQTLIARQGGEIAPPSPEEAGVDGVEFQPEGDIPITIVGFDYIEPPALAELFSDMESLEYGKPINSLSIASIQEDAEGEGFVFDPSQSIVIDYTGRSPTSYTAYVFKAEDGDGIALYLVEADDPEETILARPDKPLVINGLPYVINDYELLSRAEVISVSQTLPSIAFGDDDPIYINGNTANEAGRFASRYEYDEGDNVFVDRETGERFEPLDGVFTSAEDPEKTLSPGYYVVTGFDNFDRLLTDKRLRDPFIRIFAWTVAHAFLAVFLTFWLGLGLAILMNDESIPQQKLLRSLILIPYAIPAFISTLVWRGMLDPNLGLVNETLNNLIGSAPAWLSDPTWAKVGILMIQLWLGFPYMMLVCTGALQAIPDSIYEAAEVDGASAFARFRHLTLPLLLVAVGPLLIASFAFNFNNFTVIELFNEGGPPIANSSVPAGHTDILITYTYAQAFGSGGGTDYAFASAISIGIFVIVAVITIFNYRFTRRWEEISKNV